jgi:hypothetical protein
LGDERQPKEGQISGGWIAAEGKAERKRHYQENGRRDQARHPHVRKRGEMLAATLGDQVVACVEEARTESEEVAPAERGGVPALQRKTSGSRPRGNRLTVRASWNGRVVIADPCSARDCIDRRGERGPEFNAGYGNVVVVGYPSWSIPGNFRETLGLRSTESVFVLAAHLREPADVHVGDIGTAGQELGGMGSTGNSDGTHLHLEIRVGLTGELADGQMCVGQACYDETRRRSQYDVTSPLARFGEWYLG